jgi:hypothetical protein
MAFGLEAFKETQLGQRVGAIIESPEAVTDMISFSRHGIPAPQAVGKALLVLGPEVEEDFTKITIGRWIKEILGRHGWVPLKTGRVSPGNLFSRGMIYKKREN